MMSERYAELVSSLMQMFRRNRWDCTTVWEGDVIVGFEVGGFWRVELDPERCKVRALHSL